MVKGFLNRHQERVLVIQMDSKNDSVYWGRIQFGVILATLVMYIVSQVIKKRVKGD